MTAKRKISCKYCGIEFLVDKTRKFNATKYCSNECRKNAKREQDLEAQRKYQKRYKWLLKDADKRGQLGEVRLGSTPEKDFYKEHQQIKRELRRIRNAKT